MRRLFLGILTAAAVAALPQLLLADDEKPDGPAPQIERPDHPPAPGDRPGARRAPAAAEDRLGPPDRPEGMMRRERPARDFEGRPERGDRPEFAHRGPRPDGPREFGGRPQGPPREGDREGRRGGPPRGDRPEFARRGPRPDGPREFGDRPHRQRWDDDRAEHHGRPEFARRGPRPEGQRGFGDRQEKPWWIQAQRGGPGTGFQGRGFAGPAGQGPRMPDSAELFRRLDRDDDQQLSLDEFTAGMKRFHESMMQARQKFAAAMREHGRGPGSMNFDRRPDGPQRPGFGMVPSQVRERFASMPPEARRKAFEAMQQRFRDRDLDDRGPHRHGDDAGRRDRDDDDDHPAKSGKPRGQKHKEKKDRPDDDE